MGYYSLIQSTGFDQRSEINKVMGCCKYPLIWDLMLHLNTKL